MEVETLNCGFVQPFVDVVIMNVNECVEQYSRGATYTYVTVEQDSPATTIVLKKPVINPKWVEVWQDGFRVFNPSLDFGKTHTVYEVFDRYVQFHSPVSGNFKIVADTWQKFDMTPEYYVTPQVVQGAGSVNTTAGTVVAGYFCEPVILTQPVHGFARLTDDCRSIMYVPALNYVGNDSFSYSVFTDRGQIAQPKCVQITVAKLDLSNDDGSGSSTTTDPTTPTDPTDPTTPVDPTANDT